MKMLKKIVLTTSGSASATPVLVYDPMLSSKPTKMMQTTDPSEMPRIEDRPRIMPSARTPKRATNGWPAGSGRPRPLHSLLLFFRGFERLSTLLRCSVSIVLAR